MERRFLFIFEYIGLDDFVLFYIVSLFLSLSTYILLRK